MSHRNYVIDSLRFIAAMWVLLFHLNGIIPYKENWYCALVKQGYLGVTIFFVISGFCIANAASKSTSKLSFAFKRVCRVYPAYWVSLAITLVSLIGYKIIHGDNPVTLPKTPFTFFNAVLLTTDPVTHVKMVNYVYWTLSYEMAFYVVVTISLFLAKRVRSIAYIFIAILTIILPHHNYYPFFFVQQWPYFGVGISIYMLANSKGKAKVFDYSFILINLISFCFIEHSLFKILAMTSTALAIALGEVVTIKSSRWYNLGNYSYSIYLIHVPITLHLLGFVKQSAFVQINLTTTIITDALLALMVIFISKYMYLHIEVPAMNFAKTYKCKSLKNTNT